ncbi:MAG: hypothetical protein AMXMBFR84_30120 [Candidatus Hydrogenedentota bacterium]
MSWMPPQTEEGWNEVLSAYVDGELSFEETAGLEGYLATDTVRQNQVRELRKVSAVMSEWQAPDIRPPEAVLGKRRSTWRRFQWGQLAAGFAAGIAVGLFAASPSRDAVIPASPPVPAAITSSSDVAMSRDRADRLVRESAAEALHGQIVQLLADRKIDQAEARLALLQREYPDTRAGGDTGLIRMLDQVRERVRLFERRTG